MFADDLKMDHKIKNVLDAIDLQTYIEAYSMLGFLKRICADYGNVKRLTSIYSAHV